MSVRIWSIVGVIVAVLIGAGYYAGRRAERLDVARQARHDALEHNAQALGANARVLDTAHQVTRLALGKDSVLRAEHAIIRGRVRIVSDSQLAIVTRRDSAGVAVDSVGPNWTVPPLLVTTVRSSDAAIQQDSVTIRAQAAELTTLYRRDSLHVERDSLQQATIDGDQPARCGRRCGFVAGVTVALAVTHPAQVAKAVMWVVRLVH